MPVLPFVLPAIPTIAAGLIALLAQLPEKKGAFGGAETGTHHVGPATASPVRFRRVAFAGAAATLAAAIALAFPAGGMHRAEGPVFGSDGLSWPFVFLTAATWLPAISLARQCENRHPALLYSLLLLLESAFLGAFFADDVLLFCFCTESSTLILYLLLSGWSGRHSDSRVRKFLFFNLAGGVVLLAGLLGLAIAGARMAEAGGDVSPRLTFSMSQLLADVPRLAFDDVAAREYWNHSRRWILAALILGLALKTPLVPFHTWFTGMVAESPWFAGLLLVGTGLRATTYAFVRIIGPLWGQLDAPSGLLVGLIVFGGLHASFVALAHGDMKKLTAYASVSQTALAIAGFLSLESLGGVGAVLLSVAGGLGSALLLFVFGSLELRYGVREISLFGGIWRRLPHAAAVLLLAVFSLVGVPGLGGFAGIFPVLGAIFDVSWRGAFLALVAGLIGGWTLFWMLQRVVFGTPRLPAIEEETPAGSEGAPSDPFVLWRGWSAKSNDMFSAKDLVLQAKRLHAESGYPREQSSQTLADDATSGFGTSGQRETGDLTAADVLAALPQIAGLMALGLWPGHFAGLVLAAVERISSIH